MNDPLSPPAPPRRLDPLAPLPEVIESSTDEAWELFDAAQRARDPAPGVKPVNQPTEGTNDHDQ